MQNSPGAMSENGKMMPLKGEFIFLQLSINEHVINFITVFDRFVTVLPLNRCIIAAKK